MLVQKAVNTKLNSQLGVNLNDCKVLYQLSKPRSSYVLQYIEDIKEPWFIFFVKIKKNTGAIDYCVMKTSDDLMKSMDYDVREKWIIDII